MVALKPITELRPTTLGGLRAKARATLTAMERRTLDPEEELALAFAEDVLARLGEG